MTQEPELTRDQQDVLEYCYAMTLELADMLRKAGLPTHAQALEDVLDD